MDGNGNGCRTRLPVKEHLWFHTGTLFIALAAWQPGISPAISRICTRWLSYNGSISSRDAGKILGRGRNRARAMMLLLWALNFTLEAGGNLREELTNLSGRIM